MLLEGDARFVSLKPLVNQGVIGFYDYNTTHPLVGAVLLGLERPI